MSDQRKPLPAPDYVTIDGASIATYLLPEKTSGGCEAVVLCHGTPWSAEVWAQAAGRLNDRYRVYLWDMPGYGASTQQPDVAVDLASQMSRLAKLLAHWGLERPYVVAHDIGGAVALGAHLLHERPYAGLFLWDVVTLEPWGSAFFRLVAEHADVFAQLPDPLHAALVNEYIAGAAAQRLSPEWKATLARPWLSAAGKSAFYRQIAALRPEHTRPVAERLGQARCEVGIGWGADDPWIPVEQATRLREQLPGDDPVVRLAEVGHLSPVEAESAVTGALLEWLARSVDSTTAGAPEGW